MENKLSKDEPVMAPLVTQDVFRKTYQYEGVKENWVKSFISSHYKCTKDSFFNFLPIIRWLRRYNVKENLLSDIVAGITVAVLHIPHGLAYAPLGKVEPVVGFYMAIFPVIIYIIMGTSRQISIGTFAVLCAMVGSIVGKYELSLKNELSLNNGTLTDDKNVTVVERYENIQVGTAIALLVGIYQAGLGILRLGFCTVIMSESLVSGFTTGASIHVISLQLKNLFGVPVDTFSGPFKLYFIYYDFFNKIKSANLVTVGMSVSCISILLFFSRYLTPLIQRKFPNRKIIVPIEIIVIILGITFSYVLELNKKYNVLIVGNIPEGIPAPSIPPIQLLPSIMFDSFIIAILALATNLSLAKIFAKKEGYTISNNQELFAYGIGNIFASFFSCLPACASLSRSSVQHTSGGKTQLTSLFSICIILIVILFAGDLFEPVPYCVLSSIVVVSLVGLLLQIKELPKTLKISARDGAIWLLTFLSVVILDLDYGLGVGIALCVLSVIFNSCKVKVAEIGRVPGTDVYLEMNQYRAVAKVPKIFILQVTGVLSFVNCVEFENIVLENLRKLFRSSENIPSHVVLCMSGVSQIDKASVNSLNTVYKYLIKNSSDLYMTDCNSEVFNVLELCSFFENFPREQVISTLKNAINYLTRVT